MTLKALITAACMIYFLLLTRHRTLYRLFMLAIFLLGLIFIRWPFVTTRLANIVGIARGADLISYLSTLFLLFVTFSFYLKLRQYEQQLTVVVRELTLLRSEREP